MLASAREFRDREHARLLPEADDDFILPADDDAIQDAGVNFARGTLASTDGIEETREMPQEHADD